MATSLLKNVLTKTELIMVYQAFIQSIIDINYPIFNNFTNQDITRIEAITKRAHKIICNSECRQDCLPNFKTRWEILSCNLFNNIPQDKNHILHSLLPPKSNRSNRFILPHIKSQKVDRFIRN